MTKRSLFTVFAGAALTIVPVFAQTGTSTLGVTVGPEATFASAFSASSLTAADSKFGYPGRRGAFANPDAAARGRNAGYEPFR